MNRILLQRSRKGVNIVSELNDTRDILEMSMNFVS